MIHRIDRVNPDVDDRVIKPNEARAAENLRFGASTEDTNLSGGTLYLGNELVSTFTFPAGTNIVKGVYSDGETKNVYFAAFNSNGDHAIYQLNTETSSIAPVVSGQWLNFQANDDYNISMAIVSGLFYWTDNVNEPRMVNIQKGLSTQAAISYGIQKPYEAIIEVPKTTPPYPGVSSIAGTRLGWTYDIANPLTNFIHDYSTYYIDATTSGQDWVYGTTPNSGTLYRLQQVWPLTYATEDASKIYIHWVFDSPSNPSVSYYGPYGPAVFVYQTSYRPSVGAPALPAKLYYISSTLGGAQLYPAIPQDWQYAQIKRPPAFPLDVYRLGQLGNNNLSILNTSWLCYNASSDYLSTPSTSFLSPIKSFLQSDFINTDGYQYSYYYIYDNNEESRLAPWTIPVFYKKYIGLRLPNFEFNNYVQNNNLIKKIVFVYRIGNFGIPYIIKEIINDVKNYKNITTGDIYSDFEIVAKNPSFPIYLTSSTTSGTVGGISTMYFSNIVPLSTASIQIGINNATQIPRVPVDSAIVDARFDAVPLRSKTNSIVSNRLLHGNYVLDRNTWDDLTLIPQVNLQGTTVTNGGDIVKLPAETNLLRPSSTYKVGIELLDEYGRPITVIAEKSIKVPAGRVGTVNITNNILGTAPVLNPTSYFDDYFLNRYKATCTVTGTFPSWAKYWRLVNTGALDVQYFYKTICTIFYWYQAENGTSEFVITPRYIKNVNQINSGFSPADIYYQASTNSVKRRGYWIQVVANTPITYSEGDELYVNICSQEYNITGVSPQELAPYKVVAQIGNCFAIEANFNYMSPSIALFDGLIPTPGLNPPFTQLYYTVEFFVKKTSAEEIYYQNNSIFPITSSSINQQVEVQGDCYFTTFRKDLTPIKNNVTYIDLNDNLSGTAWYKFRGFANVIGSFVSMNPCNINAQIWTSDKGQENIVAPNQKERILPTAITFSDPIVGQSDINGLNKFNSADYRTVPTENGPITSLVVTNATQREPGVMLAISETGISSFYYDAIQLSNVDGSANVTTTNQFLASQRPLLGLFGTSRPMSISETPLGTVYWWSDMVNDLIRYSNAGLERLGLTYSFSNFLREKYKGNSLITTWYDQVTDEVLLTGKGLDTAVFSERYKTFQGTRNYMIGATSTRITPDRSIGVVDKFYNFIQGEVWRTAITPTNVDNYVFGEWKNPALIVVTNESPAVEKTWNQVKMFGPLPISTDLSAPQSNGNPAIYSYIDKGWYIARKNVWEAAIRRGTDPSITSPNFVLDGKMMESKILYSNFAFDPQTFDKINFIEIRSNASIVQ